MAQSLPLVLVPGLLCSARLYGAANRGAVAVRAGGGRRSPARRRHGGDRRANSRGCAAALRARRPVDGRLHRLRHAAAGARAHRQAGAARHLGAAGHAGADRGAREMQIAMAQAGRSRRDCRICSIPRFLHRKHQHNDEALNGDRARRWPRRPGRRPSCASKRRSCRGRIRGRCWPSIRCPTLVLVGDGDDRDAAGAATRKSPAAFRARSWRSCRTAGISRPSRNPKR